MAASLKGLGMGLASTEFEAVLKDRSKQISGDIEWVQDEDHSPSVEFIAEVISDAGWPLFVRGSYNPHIPALSYMLILKTEGRVYGLDMGKRHKNPQGGRIGEKHKHKWTEQYRDKDAYVPEDISAPPTDPVAVWDQFCSEAILVHNGRMLPPPPLQGDLLT